ncbi:MAG: alpha/beta fold hydrolase [Microcystaceae cyanobacterium]
MITGFINHKVKTSQGEFNLVQGGKGFPLLLLHGYPQTHFMWHKIAPLLAQDFTVIATDLRGYGDSFKPKGTANHDNYSKRVMAQDQVEIMEKLGYDQFYLVGHDRGARVAHRLTLDHGDKVKKLGLIDIAPTYDMYRTTNQRFATAYYHWFFLIQPYPFPETFIQSQADYYLRHCLQSWSDQPNTFKEETIQEYLKYFRLESTIHGTCEDYRASATIDLIHDRSDREQKIICPVLILWGSKGVIDKEYSVLTLWRERGSNVQGKSLNCGHFLPEECPQKTYQEIRDFLLTTV